MSDVEHNKAVIRRFYEEALNEGRFEVLDEIVADDARDNARPVDGGLSAGRAGFVQHLKVVHETVGGVKATVTDLIAEGDRVVVFWTIEGVHTGNLFGVEATGRTFKGHSVSWVTLRDGRIVEYSVLPDRLGIAAQLGGSIAS